MFGVDEVKKKQMILRKAMNCSSENHPSMDGLVQYLKQHLVKKEHLDIASIKQHKKPLKSTIFYILSVLFFILAVVFALGAIASYVFGLVSLVFPISHPVSFGLGLAVFVVGTCCTSIFLGLGFWARAFAEKHDEKVENCLSKKVENLIENNLVESLHLPASCANEKVLAIIAPKALDNGVVITTDSPEEKPVLKIVNTIQKTESSLYHIWSHLLKIDTSNKDILTSIFSQALNLFATPENEGPSALHLLQKKLTTPSPRSIRFFDKEQLEAPIERPKNDVDVPLVQAPV